VNKIVIIHLDVFDIIMKIWIIEYDLFIFTNINKKIGYYVFRFMSCVDLTYAKDSIVILL